VLYFRLVYTYGHTRIVKSECSLLFFLFYSFAFSGKSKLPRSFGNARIQALSAQNSKSQSHITTH